MDRVDSLGSSGGERSRGERSRSRRAGRKRVESPRDRNADAVSEASASFFQQFDGRRNQADIEQLLDEINEAGERLGESQTMEAIRSYRTAVSRFMGAVVERGFDVREHTSGSNILKRKKFTLVEIIDQRLESLASVVLAGQGDQLDVLRRVDEIRGLLVDLLS
jgi:uncharacterized protein YaaR (DUF327 family)